MNETKRTVLSFEEILDSEDFILFDSSIHCMQGDWYGGGVFEANTFSELNRSVLGDNLDSLRLFPSFLSNPNVYTVGGVSSELKRIRDLVAEKIKFLKSHEIIPEGDRRGSHHKKRHLEGLIQRRLIEETQSLLHDIYHASRGLTFNPEDRDLYCVLERMVTSVTNETRAKQNYDHRYGQVPRDDLEDFHSDEQLVATAYYLAVNQSQPTTIITRDSDIGRIFINTIYYLSRSKIKEFKGVFKMVRGTRIRNYYFVDNEVGCDFDSSEFTPRKIISRFPIRLVKVIDKKLGDNESS